MIIDEIREELFRLQDVQYRDFQSKLIPTVPPGSAIGVRTPALRKLAKDLSKRPDIGEFLDALPHLYFDENQLHAFLLSEMKDYDACLAAVTRFLPFVDNWATCDQMSPRVFRKHRQELLGSIRQWLSSDETYTVRFGMGMLMEHFLDDCFDPVYPEMVCAIKQYDAVLPFLEERKLDPWTHNKAIQKATESYRITPEQKAYLRNLKLARA